MIKITIIALGKIKDRWIIDGIAEYSKRLQAYCNFSITELPEAKIPQSPSEAEVQSVLNKEFDLIKAKINTRAVVIGLFIDGKMLSSEKLADSIQSYSQNYSEIVFIIGSSHGLSNQTRALCDMSLSFSPMTFPHQLMRLILTEQLYRALSIINNSSYHK